MPDPLTAVSPTKSLYDMLTSRHGLTAFAVAGMQTGMFMVVIWIGGWGFTREWSTVAMWIVFLMCSVVLLIAWAYHVYRDAEDRRERAATIELHKLSQEVLTARREAFASDESFYKARKEWASERDALAQQVGQLTRRLQEQEQETYRRQFAALASVRATAATHGLLVVDNGMGQVVEVRIVDPTKFKTAPSQVGST